MPKWTSNRLHREPTRWKEAKAPTKSLTPTIKPTYCSWATCSWVDPLNDNRMRMFSRFWIILYIVAASGRTARKNCEGNLKMSRDMGGWNLFILYKKCVSLQNKPLIKTWDGALSIWISMLKNALHVCRQRAIWSFECRRILRWEQKAFKSVKFVKGRKEQSNSMYIYKIVLIRPDPFLCFALPWKWEYCICMILKTINPCDWIHFEQRRGAFHVEFSNTHLPFSMAAKISPIFDGRVKGEPCFFGTGT